MPDKVLAQAAEELRLITEELKVLLDHHYQTKTASKRYLKFSMTTMLLSVILSYVFTLYTVSECFLGESNGPFYCQGIPGYEASQQRNEGLLSEFRELQKRSLHNERRLEKLEERLNGR